MLLLFSSGNKPKKHESPTVSMVVWKTKNGINSKPKKGKMFCSGATAQENGENRINETAAGGHPESDTQENNPKSSFGARFELRRANAICRRI